MLILTHLLTLTQMRLCLLIPDVIVTLGFRGACAYDSDALVDADQRRLLKLTQRRFVLADSEAQFVGR